MTGFSDQVKLACTAPSLTHEQIENSLLVSAGGSGYTSTPSVTITEGGGSGATATASIEGPITGIPITNGGSGYTSATVSISGNGGAEATPILNNGQIIAIRIDEGGYYTSPPTVTITGNGSGATAQATMSVQDISVTNQGSGYTSDPTVTISVPTGPEIARNPATAYAKKRPDGKVDVVLGTFPKGSSYLTFDDDTFTPEKTADWLLFTTSEGPHSPLLTTNQGVVMEKDLMVGGFVDSGQGALLLNYGLVGKPKLSSPPCILLIQSDTPYPSGGTLPSNPETGQLFNQSGNKKIWNGNYGVQNWITDNNAYTGYYDTLFLFKSDGITPAHLDLGNLTVHGSVHGNLSIEGYVRFNNDARLVWVNTSTLAVEDANGVTANGGLDVGSIFINNLGPLNNGSPAYITINCPLSFGGSGRGSSGQVLTSNGSGSAPTWQTLPGWNGGTVANNIAISNSNPSLYLTCAGHTNWQLNSYTDGKLYFNVATVADKMILDTSGNLWLAGNLNAANLQLGNYNSSPSLTITSTQNTESRINFYDNNETEGASIRVIGKSAGATMYFAGRWDTDTNRVWFDLTNGNITTTGALYGASGTLNIANDTLISHTNTVYFNVNSTDGSSVINLQHGGSTKGFLGTNGSKVYLNTSDALNLELDASGGVIYAKNDFVAEGLIDINNSTPTLNFQIEGSNKIQVGHNGSNGFVSSITGALTLTGNGSLALYGGNVYVMGGYHIIPEAYEGGYCGNSSHRWYGGYIRTVYTLGGGQYDLYDDLAIAKLWGEENPVLPDDYDLSKLKPPGSPFDFLKAKKENGELDEYFNLNNLTSFAMCCIKTSAKKQDEHDALLLKLLNEIDSLHAEIASLKNTNGGD
jgi:hypothetical protein